MNRFEKLCVILAALAVLLVGLYLYTARLEVNATLRTVPASHMQRDFVAACEALYGEGAVETMNIDDYSFVLLRAEGKCLSPFGAEWITLTLDPLPEDVCVHEGSTGPVDLGAFEAFGGEQALYVTLLTRSPETGRRARLEYYIRGRYHSCEISAEG